MEHAVDPKADHEGVVLGIEVEVARSVLGGLEDDRVDETDERSVRDAVVGLEIPAFALVLVEVHLVLDEGCALPGLGRPDDSPQLELDVLRRGD
jgi:hypothetical protein